MTPLQLFEKLEHTGNHYSYFKKGRQYVYFSTGGWSENEELVSQLEKENVWHFLLCEWRSGGHYKFKIPHKELMFFDYKKVWGAN